MDPDPLLLQRNQSSANTFVRSNLPDGLSILTYKRRFPARVRRGRESGTGAVERTNAPSVPAKAAFATFEPGAKVNPS